MTGKRRRRGVPRDECENRYKTTLDPEFYRVALLWFLGRLEPDLRRPEQLAEVEELKEYIRQEGDDDTMEVVDAMVSVHVPILLGAALGLVVLENGGKPLIDLKRFAVELDRLEAEAGRLGHVLRLLRRKVWGE